MHMLYLPSMIIYVLVQASSTEQRCPNCIYNVHTPCEQPHLYTMTRSISLPDRAPGHSRLLSFSNLGRLDVKPTMMTNHINA